MSFADGTASALFQSDRRQRRTNYCSGAGRKVQRVFKCNSYVYSKYGAQFTNHASFFQTLHRHPSVFHQIMQSIRKLQRGDDLVRRSCPFYYFWESSTVYIAVSTQVWFLKLSHICVPRSLNCVCSIHLSFFFV